MSLDLEDGGLQATRHLIGHGYTDVAIVTGRFEVPGQVDARRDGWQRALREAGLPTGPVILTDFTREGGYLATRAAIRSRSAPRAIFAASDLIAVGVLPAVHEAALSVPDDVAIVSFDGSVESEYSWPPLTTVRQPIRMIADSALDSALDPAATPPDAPAVPRRPHPANVVRMRPCATSNTATQLPQLPQLPQSRWRRGCSCGRAGTRRRVSHASCRRSARSRSS